MQIGLSATLMKFDDGYRLCGSVCFTGVGVGGEFQGCFVGISDIIGPPDKQLDCTKGLAGSIDTMVWVPAEGTDREPPCGFFNVKLDLSSD